MENRRIGKNPIPSVPELYMNEQQVYGLIILKKFGWKLICIRRSNRLNPCVILKHRRERSLGVLEEDGVLRLSDDLKIRKRARVELDQSERNARAVLGRFGHIIQSMG